ncbi:acyltransferase family protein [Pseudomonas simiae]|uniref:acyltransferase family protein n=1 Tax=Pseudomonas simiae TaxID=321846 RepID=UPI0027350B82|nr:acyltransferase family protein [Pseudomonas simiae]WLG32695.1 acyltransferase family protein [Pseudomonas simiae]
MICVSQSKDDKSFTDLKQKYYRPDIDGLRAIAVIFVILYHFNVGLFSGGFVGVDIFFVISGYLITKGILEKQHEGAFEFSDFYFRRVRRLIPALLATIVVSYIAAYILFSPADFKQMSGSTVYAISGLSNLFFWMESGYFDTSSIVKPLLHTWSLSVEIQFYIIWPFLLCLIKKVTSRVLVLTLIFTVIGAVSAVLYLHKDSSGAFFLTPFRIHEFLFGAIIVLVERFKTHKYLYGAVYFSGLALIIYSAILFDVKATVFPGVAAMIPAAGAAFIIYGGGRTKFGFLLSSKLFTKIGEISYSLYLVHWPLLVFSSYVFFDKFSVIETIGLLAGTFVLALGLYYLIEKPFRSPANSTLSGPEFGLATLSCTVVVMFISASSWAMDGWNWRLPDSIRNITKIDRGELDKYVWERHDAFNLKEGFDLDSNKEKILVIGDSQAADLVNMLAEGGHTTESDIVSRSIWSNCSTFYVDSRSQESFFTKINIMTIKSPELIEPCKVKMARAMDSKLLDNADRIYIAFRWNPEAIDYNVKAIEKIVSMTKAQVYVFGRKNLSKSSIDIVTALGRTSGISHFAARFKDEETKSLNEKLAKTKSITFVDLMKIVCPSSTSCAVLGPKDRPLFFDTAHLTKDGARYFGADIGSLIESSKRNN